MENHLDINSQFIPYNLALRLKELGFNEPCINWYSIHVNDIKLSMLGVANPEVIEKMITHPQIIGIKAPLWGQAFDWFRENHQLEVILNNCSNKDHKLYDVIIYDICKKRKNEDYVIRNRSKFYTTYEEARLACLEKLIKIIE